MKVGNSSRTGVRLLWVILAAALGLRILAVLLHPMMFPDSVDYDGLARGLVEGRGYEVGGKLATRMPGYPVMVAGVYAVCGPSVRAVLMMQALMGTAVVGVVFWITKKFVGERWGLVAAALAAVDPLSIGFGAALLTEVPFTLVLVGAVAMVVGKAENRKPKAEFCWWVGLGVLWGVGVYLRAAALWGLVPLVMLVCWREGRGRAARNLFGGVTAFVIVFAMLLPWQVRNYRIFGNGFFRMTTLEGISLYEAVYPGADGGPQQDRIQELPGMEGMREERKNDEWGRLGWGYVRAEPGRVMKLAVVKAGRTWSPWLNAAEFGSRGVQAAMVAWHVPLFALALVGMFAGLRWGREDRAADDGTIRLKAGLRAYGVLVMMGPMVYFTVVHALYLGSVRYRVPLMPLVCILAALGLWALVERFGPQRSAGPSV